MAKKTTTTTTTTTTTITVTVGTKEARWLRETARAWKCTQGEVLAAARIALIINAAASLRRTLGAL